MKCPAVVAVMAACLFLSACTVVEPAPPRRHAAVVYTQPVEPPAGVAVVGPTYVSPGPEWVWRYHPHYGWGWYSPAAGWHRGWR